MCRINLKFLEMVAKSYWWNHNYSLDQSVKLAENIRSGVEKSSFHLPNRRSY